MALNDFQKRFCEAFADHGDDRRAAIEAGAHQKDARVIARQLLRMPEIEQEVMAELFRRRTKAGSIGLCALAEIASGEKYSAAARVAASRALAEFAGLLGSAKDMREAREAAAEFGHNNVDYRLVLKQVAQAIKSEVA